jgi:hypothetical protein
VTVLEDKAVLDARRYCQHFDSCVEHFARVQFRMRVRAYMLRGIRPENSKLRTVLLIIILIRTLLRVEENFKHMLPYDEYCEQ